MRRLALTDAYHFCVTFPDRVFPFSTYINGEKVRWRRSYEHRLAQIQEEIGEGRYTAGFIAYREAFHVLGAGILIGAATLISHALWGSDVALPVLFVIAMCFIAFQEFYIQPRTHKQSVLKGFIDWCSWGAPLFLYFFIHLS